MLLLSSCAGAALTGQTVGIVGGPTLSSIQGDAPAKVKWGRKRGWMLGLAAEVRLTDDVALGFQPTLTRRASSLLVEVKGQQERVDSGGVSLDYMTLPVLVKVLAAHGRTFVSSGLELGILTAATLTEGSVSTDVRDRVSPVDLAASLGVGGILVDGRPQISLEVRYYQSLLNLAGGVTTEALPARFRASGLLLMAGVLLPLGGGR